MLFLLYGADTYRSREKLNEIIDGYKKVHQSGLNLEFFDGQDLDFTDFKNQIHTISMFREKKMIILKNVLSNNDFKTDFLKQKKLFIQSDDILVFYEKDKVLATNALFKFLKKEAKCQKFEVLSGLQLKDWIEKELAKKEFSIAPAAMEKLIGSIGNDLWRLAIELEKLMAYKIKTLEIKEEDVALLVTPENEADTLQTRDALAG